MPAKNLRVFKEAMLPSSLRRPGEGGGMVSTQFAIIQLFYRIYDHHRRPPPPPPPPPHQR